MIKLSRFVHAARYAINRTYIGATKAPFCFVPPKAKPLVTPISIRFPLITGRDKSGNAVLVKDAATERFRMELDEKIGTLFRQYIEANGGDPDEAPARLVSYVSRPFGLQIPNPDPPETYYWHDGVEASLQRLPLGYAFGASGQRVVYWDRRYDAHAIVAGTTGSGKSVAIRSIATSIIASESPEDVELVLIDMKRRSLVVLEGAPHVRQPLAYTKPTALATLAALDEELSHRRDELVSHPAIVLIVDELTDLLTNDNQAQEWFSRYVRMGRELGMFALTGTQKPLLTELGQGAAQLTLRIVGRMKDGADAKRVAGEDTEADQFYHPGSFCVVSGAGRTTTIRSLYVSDEQIERVNAQAWQLHGLPPTSCLDVADTTPQTTGKALAKAAEQQAQAEEDIARLLDEFGEELTEVSMSKRIEALGLTPKGNHWTKGKKRVEEALELYYQRETV